MLRKFLKASMLLAMIGIVLSASHASAYVSVKGYTKANGTYVAPYVRSNPNGLKSDNYGYTPSQGLYNPSYGTKGTAWDTPTYITDPTYYQGQAIYNSLHSGSIGSSLGTSVASPTKISVPANATLDYLGTSWSCNKGFSKNYLTNRCDAVVVPPNATLDYFGSTWSCNKGYSKNYLTNQCNPVIVPANASLDYWGSSWVCNTGFSKNYMTNQCDKVLVPANASLDYWGSSWVCNRGYSKNYSTNQCDQVMIPANASLDYWGSTWVCNSGFQKSGTSCVAK